MTLEELAATLPNGFHDSLVRSVCINYGTRQVTMDLSVWIGDMEGDQVERESRRDGRLVLDGVQFLSMDPPDPTCPFGKGESIWVDLCAPQKPFDAIRTIAEGCFVSGFFVNEWNSFMHVAAREAKLEWAQAPSGIDPKP